MPSPHPNSTIDVLNDESETIPLTPSPIMESAHSMIEPRPTLADPIAAFKTMIKSKKKRKQIFRGTMVVMAMYLLLSKPNLDYTGNESVYLKESTVGPQVAWLMAFPNSGTTYTQKLLHTVTDRALATNYGHEHFNEKGEEERISLSIPLLEGEEGLNGPFKVNNKRNPEAGYVLTKTHCTGSCFSDCPPNWYIHTPEKYLAECSRGARIIPSDNAPEEQIEVRYDPKIVKKAVHLFRNPFDNIVGRFHHEYRTHLSQGDHLWTDQYPDSEEGFRAWCKDSDQRFSPMTAFNSEKSSFDNAFVELALKSPCYAEIIKYAQWHNNAFATADSLGLPILNVHIEDFGGATEETVQSILEFLEQPKINDPIPYNFNSYDTYFSKEDKTNMASFLKHLSSPATWRELGRYVMDLNLVGVQINHAIADVNKGNLESPVIPVEAPQATDTSGATLGVNVASDAGVPKSIAPGPQDSPVDTISPRAPIVLPTDPVNKPQIAWLMSFPNSGTTYTEKLVQAVTDATVATNYGHEFVNENNEEERLVDSLPVFSGKLKLNGPFRLSAKPLPDGGYLLTKTHCGGYCFSDCPPNWYMYTPDMFLDECLKGARYSTEDGNDGTEQIWVQYDQEIVKKAVHLIRDPYDNIVSRFNHEHKTNKGQNNVEWLDRYPRDNTGFKKWCDDGNNRYTPSDTFHSEMTNFDRKFLDVVDRVPCFAEFIKYAQWHNNAFGVAKIMGIETHVVHYEDYRDAFATTLKGLLDFVELPVKGQAPPFAMAPYDDYYTDDERARIQGFLDFLSTKETWKELKRYFPNNAAPPPKQLGPDGRELPEIAWLMSFPNSGTTYTEKLVQMLTQKTVATNYGHEHVDALGQADRIDQSVPVFENGLDGPFRLSDAALPEGGYILTKTHCGGYCFSDCPPNWYILEPDKYLTECARGARYTKNTEGGGSEQTWVQYDPKIVKKAVHLIRDPFDNIIARFHHEYKINAREGKTEFTSQFSNDVEGFQKWCLAISQTIKPSGTYNSEKANFTPEFLEVSRDVPCYGEFIKYVLWHNNAFAVQQNLGIPDLVIKYEDYHYNFDGTVAKVLEFVKQPIRGKPPDYLWHPYEGYYSDEKMQKIARFLRFLSSERTLEVLNTEYLQPRNL